MKITNKNIHWWLLGFYILFGLKSIFLYGFPSEKLSESTWIQNFNSLFALSMVILCVVVVVWLLIEFIEFLEKCYNDKIQFEIDLSKLFKRKKDEH